MKPVNMMVRPSVLPVNAVNLPQSYWDKREESAIRRGFWDKGLRGPELHGAVQAYFDKRDQERAEFEAKWGDQ